MVVVWTVLGDEMGAVFGDRIMWVVFEVVVIAQQLENLVDGHGDIGSVLLGKLDD